ncbi:nicotinamide-nucleotide amidase [Chromatium okenii]|jgi:nicotinamide-nucleotide amidase|uniref:Damage-inducible protein CinA n=1 Tax=Chromatium okenii TaxID=61644 RepID=A0A2S7XRA8_9GAMM|nr:nicotinamide-nucleotide amidase [Chromatium okenii]MBV5307980.1 nicotinamide-nucleotide amidase [Chromatium okenii]PQJ96284.1 damage-inducible protein CinA [Chromatium okenii]
MKQLPFDDPACCAAQLGELLQQRGWRLVTAESCTGGWVAKIITDLAGSSAWFERGFVTYSNAAKQDMLGVAPALLAAHGAVSEAVVRAMVAGALAHSSAEIALAISGIAGPSGGTASKPVGTVWIGWGLPDGNIISRHFCYDGDRDAVRYQAVTTALNELLALLQRQ